MFCMEDSLSNKLNNSIRSVLDVSNDYDIDHCIDVFMQKAKPQLIDLFFKKSEVPFKDWIAEVERIIK